MASLKLKFHRCDTKPTPPVPITQACESPAMPDKLEICGPPKMPCYFTTCRKAATAAETQMCDSLGIAKRASQLRRAFFMSNDFEFEIACSDCGTRGRQIETSSKAVLMCCNCGGSRDTIAALKELAARMQELSHSAKMRTAELVFLRDELKSLRRKFRQQTGRNANFPPCDNSAVAALAFKST
jgi:hypothetical protein